MMKRILLFILLFSGVCLSQTLTFEEVLDVAKGQLNIPALREIRNLFPKDFVVTALDIGDFSGDNKNDFAIAIKPHRSNRKINIYLFCDSLDNYTLIHSDTMEFVELPIEIGFSISKEVCFVTQKLKDKNWEITGYSFQHNELSIVDHYDTDVKNIKKFQIGEEVYNNFKTLHSFVGYYDVSTLGDYKKNNFLYHPVYDRRRNLYESYTRSALIDNTWKWDVNDSDLTDIYGRLDLSKENGTLITDLRFNEDFLKKMDSSYTNSVQIFFDRSTKRLDGIVKKNPKFRESIDQDIASVSLKFKISDMDNAGFSTNMGNNYSKSADENIKLSYIKDKDLICRIRIPISAFNIPSKQNEMGVFFQIALKMKDGEKILLTNSNGYSEDPSSYGRILFLEDGEYYGSIDNYRFLELSKKLSKNGLAPGINQP